MHTSLHELGLSCRLGHASRSPRRRCRGLDRLLPHHIHASEPVGLEIRVLLAQREAVRGVREVEVPALGEGEVVRAVETVPLFWRFVREQQRQRQRQR